MHPLLKSNPGLNSTPGKGSVGNANTREPEMQMQMQTQVSPQLNSSIFVSSRNSLTGGLKQWIGTNQTNIRENVPEFMSSGLNNFNQLQDLIVNKPKPPEMPALNHNLNNSVDRSDTDRQPNKISSNNITNINNLFNSLANSKLLLKDNNKEKENNIVNNCSLQDNGQSNNANSMEDLKPKKKKFSFK
eukprot:CAMPEP_0116975954 /NCGR_PEP_ID=MMETSP0467-20121206/56164_1 /TAXON_ID=283647 /ORGANISM="Mesodinium pulex, Strain SPMC105" /LENGTH=187 /DNA_ID=CAMNT_0004668573 /DNA_START=1059 /DNA_END=1622 /DNA_ORIENTATION=-